MKGEINNYLMDRNHISCSKGNTKASVTNIETNISGHYPDPKTS